MKRPGWSHALIVLGLLSAPAGAQSASDGIMFVEAVRDRNGEKATELLTSRPLIVNSRGARGETALIIAISRRDPEWTGFLLHKGADPNLAARDGDTPLIAAARTGFGEVVGTLLSLKAKVDDANKMGETALIVAVQQRHPDIVKLLLAAGADPDVTDNAAGYSARDYAKRDNRARDILALIEESKAKRSEDINKFKL